MNVVYIFVLVAFAWAEQAEFDESNPTETEMLVHDDFKKFVGFMYDFLFENDTETLFYESHKDHQMIGGDTDSSENTFKYQNCDKPSKEIVVPSNVILKPDPLKLPGNITAGGSVQIKKGFGSPVKVALTVHARKFGVWIKVPCRKGVGSCTYDDICQKLNKVKCPPQILKTGLQCKCPFSAGNFTVKSASLKVKTKIPVSCDLSVKIVASNNGQLVTCAQMQLTLA